MALRTISTESMLTEAGNSVLTTAGVFHRLEANFGFCTCLLHVIRHSTLTRLAQKFGGKQNHEIGPRFYKSKPVKYRQI